MHPCGNKRTRKRIDLTYKNLSSTKILIKRKKRESRLISHFIARLIARFNEPFEVHLVPDIEKGEMLLDPRGKGRLQH